MIPHRPRLREYLEWPPEDDRRRSFLLRDRLRLSPVLLRLTPHEVGWLPWLDGHNTVEEIRCLASGQARQEIPFAVIARLVDQLDDGLFLDGERYRNLLHGAIRPPSCLGVYEEDPEALRRQMARMIGSHGEPRPEDSLRAMLLPHMDYARGWRVYAPGFRTLVERNAARLFVIIATSHYSSHRFTLTRKHFQSPLGVVETDHSYIDKLVSAYGDGLFADEPLAHFPEHAIELEVVPLQHLYAGKPFRIVPLVVGSFHDCVTSRRDPLHTSDIARMVAALQEVERQTREPICYLISGDLAHIGPKFGDRPPLGDHHLRYSGGRDQRLLQHLAQADPEGWFGDIFAEGDERRVCGFAPTWLTLAATRPGRGRVLAFEQFVAADRHESVSFAAAAFER